MFWYKAILNINKTIGWNFVKYINMKGYCRESHINPKWLATYLTIDAYSWDEMTVLPLVVTCS